MSASRHPGEILLADYRPADFAIDHTELTFAIAEGTTTVSSRLQVRRRSSDPATRLRLDGVDLELVSVKVDGQPLSSNAYQADATSLCLFDLPGECTVEIVNRIHPEQNTALEGLYKSGSMYCTQCEAEGFRHITYHLDRPDVLSRFTTTLIVGPEFPVALSNGNLVAETVLADGRRSVTWEDPFPKPDYLFALVAGRLALLEDSFVTRSGRTVALRIYSETHNIDQCDYAMAALKRAMRWDEEVFGREYDLDVFMIVAVEDFNMGAMENKGLNIFNTSCVLATPDTATDQAYQRVEGVVAHEYFHNWSGNRVTCRDWFQLSLKEGFTVFRDAEFSSDMNSRTVKRIEDVSFLRSVQFAEDASPLAHPIRPDSYMEISNFYTPTVYEKGAEVVRMVHTLLGAEAFRRGSDLYFERHDGMAVTTDDFLTAMADASGQDLSQFRRWYEQAGTPLIRARDEWLPDTAPEKAGGVWRLTISQSNAPTPGQSDKPPLHVPLLLALLNPEGQTLDPAALEIECDSRLETRPEGLLLHLRTVSTTLSVRGLAVAPAVSFLRGFSAPVRVHYARPAATLRMLASRDPDGFAAWDALQTLLVAEIRRLGSAEVVDDTVIDLFGELIDGALSLFTGETMPGRDTALTEQRFLIGEKLRLPAEAYLFEQVDVVDVDQVCAGRDRLREALAGAHVQKWRRLLAAAAPRGAYRPDAADMARRALHNTALGYLSLVLEDEELSGLLEDLYQGADNLTDRRAVLTAALDTRPPTDPTCRRLLEDFLERWRSQALVVDAWFSMQAAGRFCDSTVIARLAQHDAFDLRNPNKVRALYGAFCQQNLRHFHAADGSGYRLLGDLVLELDPINPQVASRLAKTLTRWRRFAGTRPGRMKAVLQQIADRPGLSPDVYEVAVKGLAPRS
ncbi:MAG: aminopeptidase N [Pseudomonadales bacterium]|nr:aminopeptidase N [Pseudomonadales bacterium]